MDDLVTEFLVESHEGLDRVDRALVDLERRPDDTALVAEIFRAVHTIKGTAGFFDFTGLEAVTHAGETVLARLRDGGAALTPEVTEALLRMVDVVRRLLATVEREGTEGDLDVSPVVAALAALGPGAAATNHGAPDAPLPSTDDPEAVGPDRSAAVDSTVRVDVEQLDRLLRLVGELALTRNQVLQHATSPVPGPGLLHVAQRLNQVAGELHERVMQTRLQPIDHVWHKLPRVVRDVAAACGKEVDLQLTGGDTELDRSLLEAIRDPLLHLVRNAVDHGLEPAEARVASGKPAVGSLALRAFHDSGLVVVEVSDDGAGIDPARIAAVARERGLLPAEELDRMSDRDLLQLVFWPGFSTAGVVTHVSGRGVGMDVVRAHVHAIGGTVEVDSTPGLGTTCRLRIPLTLAVVPALVVESAGDRYALPQAHVSELISLDPSRSPQAVEDVNGVLVHRLRGTLLPLVRLSELLGVDPGHPPDAAMLVAVVHADGLRVGLALDAVLHSEEIVVKPLPSSLATLEFYSGATILGDGRVALILDLPAVCRRVLGPDVAPQEPAARSDLDDLPPGPRLVVAGVDGGRLLGIPMRSVTRLERVPARAVQVVGDREMIRLRDDLLPVLRLGPVSSEEVSVVVHTDSSSRVTQSVALVVDDVIDIVDAAAALDGDVHERGLLGSAEFRDRIVEVVDVRAALAASRLEGAR
ncbi:chemotaxis protein CheA [Nocardioides aequoreus]|uniref:chemotaxis protein CheA n=1 Tax=Nocardioides aequoreus TaxID=397278 RepID=UPI0004C3B1CE|nr:chemotaxis protein CheA [Nocardioides aequoreus]